jgi:hypothetical protein
MARNLPWAGTSEPSSKRQRTIEASMQSPRQAKIVEGESDPARPARTEILPSKRRRTSRSPSTSPPPAPPPDVEPMVEGYDADDIWMMVEDEFQTLAQSFTRHLHHAEYKRLMRKAKEAPRKTLPEPVSPMSKHTKQMLKRGTLASKQQETLDRVISGGRDRDGSDDTGEQEVDPWRGTSLAGLMATGSQEKRSLRGLERMPSSTRAAKGFSRVELEQDSGPTDVNRHLFGGSLLKKKSPRRAEKTLDVQEEVRQERRRHRTESSHGDDGDDRQHRRPQFYNARRTRANEESEAPRPSRDRVRESTPNHVEEYTTHSKIRSQPGPLQTQKPPSLLKKRKQMEEESKEDRLAAVPMFLV